jgi:predicted dehydrogenase
VVTAVEAEGKKLGVVFQHRFRSGAAKLRGLLADKALGDLLSVSCSVRWWRSAEYYAQPGRGMLERDGGGVLLTQAIHTLDVMLDLAGPAQRVSAICRTSAMRSIDSEDIACAAVEFRNGAVGVIDATTTAYPGYPERIEFAGTLGSAVLEAGAPHRAATRRSTHANSMVIGRWGRCRPNGVLARTASPADRGFLGRSSYG